MNLYYLPVSPLWGSREQTLLSQVSPGRKAQVLAYRFEIDRKLSLFSALLVRMEVSRRTGIAPQELKFGITAGKKPFLLDQEGLFFNFSHTRDAILCGISHDGEIGVDLERIDNPSFKVMRRAFHPNEIAVVNASADRAAAFYKIWVQKEAYFKYLGTGLTDGMAGVDTTDPALLAHFQTWVQDGYVCSAFSDAEPGAAVTPLTEGDIWAFYSDILR